MATGYPNDERPEHPAGPGEVPAALSNLSRPPPLPPRGERSRLPPPLPGRRARHLTASFIVGPVQDLLSDRLLRDAPRIQFEGHTCPALGGIPLLAKLGAGGMGAVYRGVNLRLHAEVAVKVLPFHLVDEDPTLIDRFQREAQIAATVHSPHLIHVFDVNQEADLHFLVMEYVEGVTAASYLHKNTDAGNPGLPVTQALDICIAATDGLYAAHAHGVVHRDIKPDNIMIPYFNGQPDFRRTKLMDLGLARLDTGQDKSGLTAAQTTMGTPGFMAPEQALDARCASPRSDVFSMGATLYALISGAGPFRRDGSMKTLIATVHEAHVPLAELRGGLPQSLCEIVDHCLAKDAALRYADAEELIEVLKTCRRQAGIPNDPSLSAPAVHAALAVTPIGAGATQAESSLLAGPGHGFVPPQGQAPASEESESGAGRATYVFKKANLVSFAPSRNQVLYAALGFTALLLVGGGYWMTRPAKLSVEMQNAYRRRHKDDIKAAREYAEAGRFLEASLSLNEARRIELGDPALRQSEAAAAAFIAESQSRLREQQAAMLKAFDALVAQQDLERAGELLAKLKLAAPSNESVAKELAAKELAHATLARMRQQETRVQESLDLARRLAADRALEPLEQARTLLRGNTLRRSNEGLRLAREVDSLSAQIKEAQQELIRNKAKQERVAKYMKMLGDADRLIASGEFEQAENLLAGAENFLPGNPEAARRKDRIATAKEELRRGERFKYLLKSAGELLAEKNSRESEAQLKEADTLFPANTQTRPLWQNLAELQEASRKAANEQQKQLAFARLLSELDELLDRKNCSLSEAEAKLNSASKMVFSTPAESIAALEPRREKLLKLKAQMEQQAKAVRLAGLAAELLDRDGDLELAQKTLGDLARLSPQEPRLDALRARLVQRREERERKAKFEAAFQEARQALSKGGDLGAIGKQIAAAAAINPSEPRLAAINEELAVAQKKANELAIEQERRAEFERLVGEARESFANHAAFSEVDKKIADAEKLYQGDARLADLRRDVKAAREAAQISPQPVVQPPVQPRAQSRPHETERESVGELNIAK